MPDRSLRIKPRQNEDYFEALQLVKGVCEAYARVHEFSDVATLSHDDEAPSQMILRPGSPGCHFKIDVELITSRILKESPDLQLAWFALAMGETITTKDEHALVRRLSKAYQPLHPGKYFRPSKDRLSVRSAERLRRLAA